MGAPADITVQPRRRLLVAGSLAVARWHIGGDEDEESPFPPTKSRATSTTKSNHRVAIVEGFRLLKEKRQTKWLAERIYHGGNEF